MEGARANQESQEKTLHTIEDQDTEPTHQFHGDLLQV